LRTWMRDLVTTALVAALAVAYVGYLVRGEIPLVADVQAMAGAGLVLGLFAFVAGADPRTYGSRAYLPVAAVGGLATLALGLAAFTTGSAGVLGAFVVAVGTMWALATVHHARARRGRRP